MTHVCCPGCGVRFSRASAVNLVACPECGGPPQSVPGAEYVLGYRLASASADHVADDTAVAVAMPRPSEGGS